MECIDMIVDFEKYCKTCKFKNVEDDKGQEPCCGCLDNPINVNSERPVYYEEDEELIKKEEKKEKEEN